MQFDWVSLKALKCGHLSVIECVFESRSTQTKDYEIGIMCPLCLPGDCCFQWATTIQILVSVLI
jgi:hypothetical protein